MKNHIVQEEEEIFCQKKVSSSAREIAGRARNDGLSFETTLFIRETRLEKIRGGQHWH